MSSTTPARPPSCRRHFLSSATPACRHGKAASAVLRQQLGSKRLEAGGGGPTAWQTKKLEDQASLVRRVATMELGALGNVIQAKGKPGNP